MSDQDRRNAPTVLPQLDPGLDATAQIVRAVAVRRPMAGHFHRWAIWASHAAYASPYGRYMAHAGWRTDLGGRWLPRNVPGHG
jgi:hypothetical protein